MSTVYPLACQQNSSRTESLLSGGGEGYLARIQGARARDGSPIRTARRGNRSEAEGGSMSGEDRIERAADELRRMESEGYTPNLATKCATHGPTKVGGRMRRRRSLPGADVRSEWR